MSNATGGQESSEPPNTTGFPHQIQSALTLVAVFSGLAAALSIVYPERVDDTVAVLLGIAILALIAPRITRFKGWGLEIEARLEARVDQVERAVQNLEKDVGPGSRSATPQVPPGGLVAAPTPADPNDPNKGQFGGSPEANGRRLSARIEQAAGPKSSRCRVYIKVESTDSERPLKDPVRFYLHPSFGAWSTYVVDPIRGTAKDEILSYGAFTIGVEADGGQTRLELDLAEVDGGTPRFYLL